MELRFFFIHLTLLFHKVLLALAQKETLDRDHQLMMRDSITWIFPRTPVLSILLATFTVFPQISYCGFWAPMTPAITGPWLIPDKEHIKKL